MVACSHDKWVQSVWLFVVMHLVNTGFAKCTASQNNAARIVFKPPKHCPVSPLLRSLHWLVITKGIDISFPPCVSLSLMAQTQNTCLNCWPATPLLDSFVLLLILDYLEFLHSKQRQTEKDFFFSLQAATVWNNLPQTVRYSTSISSFKSSLKTHLFSKYTENILNFV